MASRRPPTPSFDVQPKFGEAFGLPRLLLIKPDCFFDRTLQRQLRDAEAIRADVVAQEIKALVDAPNGGLLDVPLATQGPDVGVGGIVPAALTELLIRLVDDGIEGECAEPAHHARLSVSSSIRTLPSPPTSCSMRRR